jgi:myo-inositol-1(or 4)-monophosphatase
MSASDTDWLAFCRRSADAVRRSLAGFTSVEERAVEAGLGAGGDTTLVIDRAAEEAVFAELEALGEPVTAIAEERGEVAIAGGGSARVVIDPVDGSLNAKRGIPFAALSIAVADGPRMADVQLGFVASLAGPEEWWAVRGAGAHHDGKRLEPLAPGSLEIVALETARPSLVVAAGALQARRVRALGSVALALCLVADGRVDAMASLRAVRSVDAAAGQLVAREAAAAVDFPEAGGLEASLGLSMRSRVLAARAPAHLERLRAAVG